jgi:hypothetical protein
MAKTVVRAKVQVLELQRAVLQAIHQGKIPNQLGPLLSKPNQALQPPDVMTLTQA